MFRSSPPHKNKYFLNFNDNQFVQIILCYYPVKKEMFSKIVKAAQKSVFFFRKS